MTLIEADKQLAQWQEKQALIEENLRSFVQLPAFERVTSGALQLPDDASRTQAQAAQDVFEGLRAQLTVLSQTVSQAKSLRESLPRIMPSKQALQEIDHLLNGNSIQLASSPTPPQRRELLRDIEQAEWVSPARLLEIMLDSFRFVRDTVLDVDEAAGKKQRDATDRLTAAQVMLQQLRELHGRAKSACGERQLKVDGIRATINLPCSDEEMTALGSWLAKLQSAVERADFDTASAGLSRWIDAATRLLMQNQSSVNADESLLRQRRELRGLFDSLRAKAVNIGRDKDASMAVLADGIYQLLSQRPTSIEPLRSMINQYQQSLL